MTTGERIKLQRKKLSMSAEQLAEKVNLSPATIYRYEKGDIEKVPADILKKIARALNSSPAYLMGWEPDSKSPIPAGFQPLPKRDRIPRVGQIACGTPILAEENVEAYDEVPSDWHADFTLLCQGAAVLIDGEATLKRVFLFDDHIELRAENPTFPTILRIGEDMNTITIEGKAVGLCRKL